MIGQASSPEAFRKTNLSLISGHLNTVNGTTGVDGESVKGVIQWERDAPIKLPSIDDFSGTLYYDSHASFLAIDEKTPQELADTFAKTLTSADGIPVLHKLRKLVFLSCDVSPEYIESFSKELRYLVNDHLPSGQQNLEIISSNYKVGLKKQFYESQGEVKTGFNVIQVGSKGLEKYVYLKDFGDSALSDTIFDRKSYDFSKKNFLGQAKAFADIKIKRAIFGDRISRLKSIASRELFSIGNDVTKISFTPQKLYLYGFRLKDRAFLDDRETYLKNLADLDLASSNDFYIDENVFSANDGQGSYTDLVKALVDHKDLGQFVAKPDQYPKSYKLPGDLPQLMDAPPSNSQELVDRYKDVLSDISTDVTIDYEGNRDRLGATDEILDRGSEQIEDFTFVRMQSQALATEIATQSIQGSIALEKDHAHIARKILEALPEGAIVDENSVHGSQSQNWIEVEGRASVSGQKRSFTVRVPKSELSFPSLTESLHTRMQEHSAGTSQAINRAIGIYGTFMGLRGAVNSLERGDIGNGAIMLSQAGHGIGELTGVNRKIYQAAARGLGKAIKPAMQVGEKWATQFLSENAGRIFGAASEELGVFAREAGLFLEDVPLVGTAFGIYNIEEDLKRHDTLGYIDAGLDTAITALSLLVPEVPELEPVVILLTVLRLGVDDFYIEISNQLKKLPPDATDLQKAEATFKGIGLATKDLWENFTLIGQIYHAIDGSKKLDRKYHDQQDFLESLKDYRNYYSVHDHSIDFLSGKLSADGGRIEFKLGEPGENSHLSYDSYNGDIVSHDLSLNADLNTIVLGLGESQNIKFKTESVKLLWFIPVDKKRMISQMDGDQRSIHGRYTGNSADNTFIAVQDLPVDQSGKQLSLSYNLDQYHYQVYGEAGDDTFILGPQNTFVEGGSGSDTYVISEHDGHIAINNCTKGDSQQDRLVLGIPLAELTSGRDGNDLIFGRYQDLNQNLTSPDQRLIARSVFADRQPVGTALVRVQSWFKNPECRHLSFQTEDGAGFDVQPNGQLQVKHLNYQKAQHSVSVDLDPRQWTQSPRWWDKVRMITGSPFDDNITGNNQDNIIMPGGIGPEGFDILTGGGGKDTYLLVANSRNLIDNHADDRKLDTIVIPFAYDDLVLEKLDFIFADSLVISASNFQLIVKNWFTDEANRHAVFISKDGVIFTGPQSDSDKSLNPIVVNRKDTDHRQNLVLSQSGLQTVRTAYGSLKNRNIIQGNGLDNTLVGGDQGNSLNGASGNDTIKGGASKDFIQGEQGNDTLTGAADRDHIDGGIGDDILFGGEGSDTLIGGKGFDAAIFAGDANSSTGVQVNLKAGHVIQEALGEADKIDGIETVFGSPFADQIFSYRGEQWLYGMDGDDTFEDSFGHKYFNGGNGTDKYRIWSKYSGIKTIENFAIDESTDYLYFNDATWEDLRFYRADDDTSIIIGVVGRPEFRLKLLHWYKGSRYQHLKIKTQDRSAVYDGELSPFGYTR